MITSYYYNVLIAFILKNVISGKLICASSFQTEQSMSFGCWAYSDDLCKDFATMNA